MPSSVTITLASGNAPLFTQQGVGTTPGYDAIDIRRMLSINNRESVSSSTAWKVTQRAAGVNMSVDVAANVGTALVQGDAVTNQGLYQVETDDALANLTVTTANGSNPRIDRVVLEIKDNQHDSSALNLVQLRIIDGTPTTGATLTNLSGAPALPASAQHLAYVLVGTGVTSIANAVILDGRVVGHASGDVASGAEGLRIVRGRVTGSSGASSGTGFTSARNSLGNYTITFSPAFSAAPSVTAMMGGTARGFIYQSTDPTATAAVILTRNPTDAAQQDTDFDFIAAGPR